MKDSQFYAKLAELLENASYDDTVAWHMRQIAQEKEQDETREDLACWHFSESLKTEGY